MPRHHFAFVVAVATAACATSGGTGASASAAAPASGPLRWTGNLQATQQRTGELAPTQQQKATGTVSLSVSPRDSNRTLAHLTVSAPVQEAGSFPWAVLPGRCGAHALPLVGVEQFPQIEIGSNGRGEIQAEVPMTLPSSGTFHVNVYWRGQQLSDVMTCANLRREGGD